MSDNMKFESIDKDIQDLVNELHSRVAAQSVDILSTQTQCIGNNSSITYLSKRIDHLEMLLDKHLVSNG